MESTLAILSVGRGRTALARRVTMGERVPVTIRGHVVAVWGRDDGIDQEFQVDIDHVVEGGKP